MEERRWRVAGQGRRGAAALRWRKGGVRRGARAGSRRKFPKGQGRGRGERSGAEFGAAVTGRGGCASSVRRTGGRRKGGEQVGEAVASGKAICGERSGSLKRRLC